MIISRGEWNMTKNRIVKYVANTALLAVLAAAGTALAAFAVSVIASFAETLSEVFSELSALSVSV